MSSLILKRAKVIQNNAVNDNILINGNFDIWQRGSSFLYSDYAEYTADRWNIKSSGTSSTQRIYGNIGLDNTFSCLRNSIVSNSGYSVISQAVDTSNTSKLRGKTVTLSFYARYPSGLNNWTGPVYAEAFYSNITDNITNNKLPIINSIFSGILDSGNYTWGLYSKSFTVPNNASTLAIEIKPSGALRNNSTIDIARVKLEVGNLATSLLNKTYDEELYECKRYYQKVDATLKAGTAGASTAKKTFGLSYPLQVKPRTTNPTITQASTSNIALDTMVAQITNDSYLNVSAQSNSPYSQLSSIFIIDNEISFGKIPDKINYIDVIRNSGTVILDWNPPVGAEFGASYGVLYGTTPQSLNQIASFTASSGSITGLSDSIPYYFQIKTSNSFGVSPLSDLVQVAPLYSLPSGNTSFTGLWGGNNNIILTWSAPQNDGGSAVTGYRIDISAFSDFRTSLSTRTTFVPSGQTSLSAARFTTDTTSTSGYYNRIIPINLAGTGLSSSFFLSKTTPLPPNTISTLASASQTITVNYTKPTGDGGANISSVRLQYSTGITFINPVSISYAANYQPINITGLTNGSTYYFRMQAANYLGYSQYGSVVSNTPNRTLTVPNAPTGLGVSWFDDDTVNFTWSAPADNGGSPIINYTISLFSGADTSTLLGNQNTRNDYPGIIFDIPTQGSYSTFYFRSKANNSIGSSTYSSGVSLSKQTPAAPILNVAQPGNTTINASWSKPISRGSPITGYQLDYSTSSTFASSVSTIRLTGTAYNITSLTNSTPYYIRVRAYNTIGSGSYSNILTSTPLSNLSAPNAPGSLALKLIKPFADPYSNSNTYLSQTFIGNSIVFQSITVPDTGGIVLGSNPYGIISPIRTAAVHGGFLGVGETGIIYYETLGPLSYVTGSTRNGITSLSTTANYVSMHTYKIIAVKKTAGSSACLSSFTAFGTTGQYFPRAEWATSTNNGGSTITGYEIQYASNSSFTSDLSTIFVPGNLSSSSDCIQHTGLNLYSRIRAINSVGASPWTNAQILNKNLYTPSAPQIINFEPTGTPIPTGIKMVWSFADTGGDSINNTSFGVEYSSEFDQTPSTTTSTLISTNQTTSPATGVFYINRGGFFYLSLKTQNSAYVSKPSITQSLYVRVAYPPPKIWTIHDGNFVDYAAKLRDYRVDSFDSVYTSYAVSSKQLYIDLGSICYVTYMEIGPAKITGWGWYYLNGFSVYGSKTTSYYGNMPYLATINNNDITKDTIRIYLNSELRWIVIGGLNKNLGVGELRFY